MKKITLELDADKIVQIVQLVGIVCLVCKAYGSMTRRYGYPHGHVQTDDELVHKLNCPMNAHINEDGSLRE